MIAGSDSVKKKGVHPWLSSLPNSTEEATDLCYGATDHWPGRPQDVLLRA